MIYWDSGVIIRLIEGSSDVRTPIEMQLAQFRRGVPLAVTSRLTRLECRAKPLREGQQELLAIYQAFFTSPEVSLLEVSAEVIEKATDLRAAHGLKAADAIHAATATLCGASEFWTADQGFQRCSELKVLLFAAV
jgi:predicted nucleic acid-binding protein